MADDRSIPSSFDSNPEFFQENGWKKLGRRMKEEPLVPIGDIPFPPHHPKTKSPRIAATCYALWRAYRSMKLGDSVQVNRMFRARIYAQAFTLLAVCGGGMYYKAERAQRKELEKAMDEKKAQAKRDAWLKELEIRDQEDRDWKQRHATIERAAKDSGSNISLKEPSLTGSKTENTAPESKDDNNDSNKASGVLDAVKNLGWGSK
ncbi:Respiratory supercomplex factor 1, mitochondrial [Myotisia sp. PD_48]|nr:Respiratory supercomplex factor 1, mitochondrial [Myotisia sp. PD_48]